ncbi:Z1 domain-containing protein, partial [Alphaproteobacteria bacterium]|nr:Z1 domain-containing protein [Alphaproteobacteria bacterium]
SSKKRGIADPEIASLKEVWENEFTESYSSWDEVQLALHEAIAAAQVVTVNSKSQDILHYPREEPGKIGKKYIAVGGYSLSRGLTLEGLTVTWFLRNTKMYDTLMQMGRWFGYRTGYEDLCRIWMPAEAIGWYAYIANATEELHSEIHDMEAARATPRDFGLAVRSHPAALLVTARNKMGASNKVTTHIGLSNKLIETTRVSIRPDDLSANRDAAKALVSSMKSLDVDEERSPLGALFRGIPVEIIDEFLIRWRNERNSKITDPDQVRKYINARRADELHTWDVVIRSLVKGEPDETLGTPIRPGTRSVDLADLQLNLMSLSRNRRLGNPKDEAGGVDKSRVAAAEARWREDKGTSNYPGSIYRKERDRGLLILYYIRAKAPEGREDADEVRLIPADPVVAWAISFPMSSRPTETVEYVVNTVRYQELFGSEDTDEDEGVA